MKECEHCGRFQGTIEFAKGQLCHPRKCTGLLALQISPIHFVAV